MKPVERFFRKYFLSMVGINALFLFLNVVLFFSVLLWAWQTSEAPEPPIKEICDSIMMDEEGHFATAEGLSGLLEGNHAWVMILDDAGTVIFQSGLPEELPRKYTAADVAKFSRWYLGDYPVYVREHPQGLLVVGGEKGSRVKYYFSVSESYARKLLVGLAAVFLTNIIVVVLLIWKNIRHVEKAVTPILRGIETVSSGQPVSLPEKGELAEINRRLNKAGAFIAKKDTARADWISGVSHDVRTPLSVILGFAGQMEDDRTLSASAREQATCIRKQGERLRSLISDLNLTSRLEYAMQPLRMEKVYLVELVRQVVCEFLDGGLEERYEIEFCADQGSESVSILGDEALLKRALGNLIRGIYHYDTRLGEEMWMEQKILAFMKENGIAVFVEADQTTGAVHIEKLGDLESWDLFQQLVLYSDVEALCDSTRSQFPFQVWGQGGTGCLLSWLDGGKAVALFFDSELSGPAFTEWVEELDPKVRGLYP